MSVKESKQTDWSVFVVWFMLAFLDRMMFSLMGT